jgi:outer membrane protein
MTVQAQTIKQLTIRFLIATVPALGFAQDSGLSLENALKQLSSGPDWQNADLTYAASERALESAKAAAGIRVNAGSDYALSQRIDTENAANSGATIKADASIGLLPWSASFDAIRSAERNLVKASLDRRDQHNQAFINASNQYFSLRSSQTDLELAQATLKWREAQLAVGQKQLSLGQITRENLSTQQVNLENAKSNLQQAQNTLEINRLTLANTLGVNASTINATASAPLEPKLPTETLEGLVKQAWVKRSDVRKASIALEQAQDELGNAQRDRWLPNASINLGIGQQYSARGAANVQGTQVNAGLNFQNGNFSVSGSTPIYSSSLTDDYTSSTSYTLSASISVPVWNPSSDAKIASAQRNLDAAKAAIESSRRSAELDVRNQYLALINAKNRIGVSRLSQTQSAQNLETTQAKLDAGLLTALDLENARVQKRQSDRDLEGNIANAQVAGLRLEHALGLELGVSRP